MKYLPSPIFGQNHIMVSSKYPQQGVYFEWWKPIGLCLDLIWGFWKLLRHHCFNPKGVRVHSPYRDWVNLYGAHFFTAFGSNFSAGASAGEAEPSAGCAGGCGLPLAGHCRAAVPAFQGPRGRWHPRTAMFAGGYPPDHQIRIWTYVEVGKRGGPELDRPNLCGSVWTYFMFGNHTLTNIQFVVPRANLFFRSLVLGCLYPFSKLLWTCEMLKRLSWT